MRLIKAVRPPGGHAPLSSLRILIIDMDDVITWRLSNVEQMLAFFLVTYSFIITSNNVDRFRACHKGYWSRMDFNDTAATELCVYFLNASAYGFIRN